MACLKADKGTIETRLYIVFNHEGDEAFGHCRQHLLDTFNILHQVPYKPPAMDGSPKVIARDLQNNLIDLCTGIHNYSFNKFTYHVTKRKGGLAKILGYIKEDGAPFEGKGRSLLQEFLLDVDGIIALVTQAQTTKQLHTSFIRMLLNIYSYWTKHGLLPKDLQADHKLTLLERTDNWLRA
jgi:hypothetical protein